MLEIHSLQAGRRVRSALTTLHDHILSLSPIPCYLSLLSLPLFLTFQGLKPKHVRRTSDSLEAVFYSLFARHAG